MWDCITGEVGTGADIGGDLIGIPGKIIGDVTKAAVGAIKRVFDAVFDR